MNLIIIYFVMPLGTGLFCGLCLEFVSKFLYRTGLVRKDTIPPFFQNAIIAGIFFLLLLIFFFNIVVGLWYYFLIAVFFATFSIGYHTELSMTISQGRWWWKNKDNEKNDAISKFSLVDWMVYILFGIAIFLFIYFFGVSR